MLTLFLRLLTMHWVCLHVYFHGFFFVDRSAKKEKEKEGSFWDYHIAIIPCITCDKMEANSDNPEMASPF